jgi:hypothetical protein
MNGLPAQTCNFATGAFGVSQYSLISLVTINRILIIFGTIKFNVSEEESNLSFDNILYVRLKQILKGQTSYPVTKHRELVPYRRGKYRG